MSDLPIPPGGAVYGTRFEGISGRVKSFLTPAVCGEIWVTRIAELKRSPDKGSREGYPYGFWCSNANEIPIGNALSIYTYSSTHQLINSLINSTINSSTNQPINQFHYFPVLINLVMYL